MKITYDGKNYNGFQKQKNCKTIQGELESALKTFFKQDILTIGSGRTDAGVSAFCQPVHFETEKEFDKNKFILSINGILPADIKVLSIYLFI